MGEGVHRQPGMSYIGYSQIEGAEAPPAAAKMEKPTEGIRDKIANLGKKIFSPSLPQNLQPVKDAINLGLGILSKC